MACKKLWAPVPWILETAFGLEVGPGMLFETSIVVALSFFNAVVGLIRDGRARSTIKRRKRNPALGAEAISRERSCRVQK